MLREETIGEGRGRPPDGLVDDALANLVLELLVWCVMLLRPSRAQQRQDRGRSTNAHGSTLTIRALD